APDATRAETGHLETTGTGPARMDTTLAEPALIEPHGAGLSKNGVHENAGSFGNKVFETPSPPDPAGDRATPINFDVDPADDIAASINFDADPIGDRAASSHFTADLAGDGAAFTHRG